MENTEFMNEALRLAEEAAREGEVPVGAVVTIGNKIIGDNHPCFVIAEIGINHNGSLELAKKLINIAHFFGCDAVKFQKRTVEDVYTKEELETPRQSVFGETNGDLKRGLEFGEKEYLEMANYKRSFEANRQMFRLQNSKLSSAISKLTQI